MKIEPTTLYKFAKESGHLRGKLEVFRNIIQIGIKNINDDKKTLEDIMSYIDYSSVEVERRLVKLEKKVEEIE